MPVNPAIGSLIQNIGIGLLTSDNPWAGLGRGVQSWQQMQLEDELRRKQQANIDKQFAQDDKRLDQSQRQFEGGQELTRQGWEHQDRAAQEQRSFTANQADLNRSFEMEQAKQAYARQLALAGVNNQYVMSHLNAQAALEKANMDTANGAWKSGEYYDPEGNRGVLQTNARGETRYMAPGTNEWVLGAPKATQEPTRPMFGGGGPELPKAAVTKDYTDFQTEANAVMSGKETLEGISRMRDLSKTANIGTDLGSMASRAFARFTGYGANDADTLLTSDAGRQQLRQAIENMKGQGQITEKERELLAQTVADPTKLSPQSFQEVLNIMERSTMQRMDMMRGYLKDSGGSYKPGTWSTYKANWALNGSPPAGASPQQQPANQDDALISKYLQ